MLAALLPMVGEKLGEAPVLDDYVVTNLLPELLKSADSQVCCLASQLLLEAWKRQNPPEDLRAAETKETLHCILARLTGVDPKGPGLRELNP